MPVPMRILIVEDSADDAEVALLELTRGGIAPDARRVESAAELRAALAEGPWDVVLSDYTMPGFGAVEAFALCRAADRDLPFVVVSGTIGEQRAVEMMRAGAGDYLLKGNLTRLCPAVRREVREAEGRRGRRGVERQARDLAAIVASSDDAIVGKTLDGIITSWNAGAERLYGYAASAIIGRSIAPLIAPDRPDEEASLLDRVASGERVQHFETERVRKDGTRVYVSITLSPVRDDEGRVVGASAIARDITDRKRGERELRQTSDLLRAVVEGTPDAVFAKDRAGKYLLVNAAAARFIGRPPAEVLGKDDTELFDPASAATMRAQNRQVMAADRAETTEETLTAAGVTRTYLATEAPFRDETGAVVGVVGIARDITARKIAEEALQASEERYRAVVEDQTEAVCRVRADGTFLFVNGGFCRLVGKPPSELIGQQGFTIAHPDDVPHVQAALATLSLADPIVVIENRVVGLAGAVRWMEFVNRGFFGAEGELVEFQAVGRDVTDRKRAEAAVRASEDRYRRLADAMPQIVWATRPDGHHEFYNRQWYDYTGLTFGESDGEAWNRFFHPDDQPLAWERWKHSLATGETYEIEYRCRRHDGEYRWFLGRALPQRDEQGQIIRWFGTCTDIHDFKLAEAERAALLDRLDLQIERMPLAYVLHDADFRYTGWNPAAERTFGFTRAEVLGRHPFDVVVPAHSQALVADIFARLKAGAMDAHATNENVTRDKRTITCEWYNTPLFDAAGTFTGVLSLAQDVTERKQMEEQYHQAQQRLRHVVASSPVVLFTLALADEQIRGVDWISDNLLEVLGHRPEAALCPDWWLANIHPDDRDRIVAQTQAELFGHGRASHEYRFRQGDGGYRWTRGELRLIRDATGHPVEVVGSWSDITERKSLEEQFRQAQKMEAVGQLAGGVAHDFNNLLTVINGYGEIVFDALPAEHPCRELVVEIQAAGDRAAGLTRQLLAFSRQTVLEPKVLDPNTVVQNIERLLGRLIGEDIDLATRLAVDLGRVKADAGQLEQAIMNLCVNARDAMPRGGQITIETHDVELDETYVASHPDVRTGPYVLVAVTDTGAGMTPEVQARIFDPFFTTKEQGKGTGLGLAMVFGFAKQSGGHVAVYSEVGQGSTFKLYLPRVAEMPLTAQSTKALAAMPHGTETVLLVEDEDAVRALGRHVLQLCGYTVLEAGHGREAARIATGHTGPIHLLVTDVVMPGGMGGREVAEAVVALHPETRVLYTSGYTDDAVVRHGVLDEGIHFLRKPFTPAALAGKVRTILDATVAIP
jgi:two-component system, cell cycle sensor histidine kinase and response regulator CckA